MDDTTTDAWRFRILPTKKEKSPCTSCRYVKSKTCGSRKKELKCKRSTIPNPSLRSIGQSMSKNCCTCCCMCLEFLKEALKTIEGDPNTRVCDFLGEISDLLLALANDCVLLLRRVCRCFVASLYK